MSLKKYLEHHVQVHTLRFEMIGGKVLLYTIDANAKEELENWLQHRTNDLAEFSSTFLSFYASPDRMVFMRIAAIGRLIFCWDAAALVTDPCVYHDNFKCSEKEEDELFIPEIIILLHGITEPLLFSNLNPEEDFLGFDEQSFDNEHFLKGGFISLPDEDGEQNYIPVTNIDCLETARVFIYSDEAWEEMERRREIENNKN